MVESTAKLQSDNRKYIKKWLLKISKTKKREREFMGRKARVALLNIFLLLVIFSVAVILLNQKATADIPLTSSLNGYSVTPPEIKSLASIASEQDSNWKVEWFETYQGVVHKEYIVAVQNRQLSNAAFNASILLTNLSFDKSKLKNLVLFEWKNTTQEVPHFDSVETCYYPPSEDNSSNTTACFTRQVENGVDTVYALDWKKSKDLANQPEIASKVRHNYGTVNVDKLGSKVKDDTEDGTKYFKVSFDVPPNSAGDFGLVEETLNKLYHPSFGDTWNYRRVVTCEDTTSTNHPRTVPCLVILDTASLISAGKMQSDCGDLRIVNGTDTEMDLNITAAWDSEVGCNKNQTHLWFNISTPINSGQEQNFTLYYGNSTVSNFASWNANISIIANITQASRNLRYNNSVIDPLNNITNNSRDDNIGEGPNDNFWGMSPYYLALQGDSWIVGTEYSYRTRDSENASYLYISFNSTLINESHEYYHLELCTVYSPNTVEGGFRFKIMNETSMRPKVEPIGSEGDKKRVDAGVWKSTKNKHLDFYIDGQANPEDPWYCGARISKLANLTSTLHAEDSNNTAPIINITLSPIVSYDNSPLNCTVGYGDNEGNSGTVQIRWFNGTNLTFYETSTFLNVPSGSIVSDNLSTGIQAIGETWNCSANATDLGGLLSNTNSTTTTIQANITFDVKDGENINVNLSSNINCSNSFTKSSIGSPYSANFSLGDYICTFAKTFYFNETVSFTADSDKIVSIILSATGGLTTEEHNLLESIYNCVYGQNCTLFKLANQTNNTLSDVWKYVTKTNRAVVTQEQFLSNTTSSSSNITINYTINIPYKAGYASGDLLPLRMYFWFHDGTRCFNQDMRSGGQNRAVAPYCFPLIAETLGPNNGSVNFVVDLRPNLTLGTYSVTRAIEIDPIIDGLRTWTNYGQEEIGQITVGEGALTPEINLAKTGETYPSLSSGSVLEQMTSMTGNAINSAKTFLTSSDLITLAGMGMLTFVISLITIVISITIYKTRKLQYSA
ncbi:MAG: hypothetical protein A3D92_02405 [Bacteroidetes bacterium RIFCSPHIGHO2_02_FULL_44_7]|nr:MAG: hypothetical protein A3D92_02405 [Bacteroidetes bacterium RIFCSPHIGHO2_02_FULL_44_7]